MRVSCFPCGEWQIAQDPARNNGGAFDALLERRELTGLEIAEEFSAFNAVYIATLLAALPDVAVCTRPIRLIFVGHQLFYLP